MVLVAYTDGACSGNPGRMGIGIVVYRNGKKIGEVSESIGDGTNNIAEYTAIIRAIEFARLQEERELHIRTDSELVVKQLTGKYRIKDKKLKLLYGQIFCLSEGMKIIYEHIPREQNSEADKLAKKGAE
jgi:ribonuclease HI